jgi:allantoin racemase
LVALGDFVRLLVVNPNSSEGVTARIRAAAEAAALPGEQITTVAATGAPDLIVTPQDALDAVDAVLAAVERHGAGVDGIVLASFGDTGIDKVRAHVSVPVVGIARAAYAVAGAMGDHFAIVSFSPAVAPSLRSTVEHYGLITQLAALHTVEGAQWSSPGAIQDELCDALRQLCLNAAETQAVRSIVLGGGPLAGLAARLQPDVPLPVIDGTTAAVAILRLAVADRRVLDRQMAEMR